MSTSPDPVRTGLTHHPTTITEAGIFPMETSRVDIQRLQWSTIVQKRSNTRKHSQRPCYHACCWVSRNARAQSCQNYSHMADWTRVQSARRRELLVEEIWTRNQLLSSNSSTVAKVRFKLLSSCHNSQNITTHSLQSPSETR